MIESPSFDNTFTELLKNMNYYPWFMDYMVKSMDKYSCPGLTEKAIMYMSGRKNECALKFHGYLLVRHMFYVDMA